MANRHTFLSFAVENYDTGLDIDERRDLRNNQTWGQGTLARTHVVA